jgi:hypothetical protein
VQEKTGQEQQELKKEKPKKEVPGFFKGGCWRVQNKTGFEILNLAKNKSTEVFFAKNHLPGTAVMQFGKVDCI